MWAVQAPRPEGDAGFGRTGSRKCNACTLLLLTLMLPAQHFQERRTCKQAPSPCQHWSQTWLIKGPSACRAGGKGEEHLWQGMCDESSHRFKHNCQHVEQTRQRGKERGWEKSHRFSFPAPEVFQLGLWAGPIWWAAPEPMFRGATSSCPPHSAPAAPVPGARSWTRCPHPGYHQGLKRRQPRSESFL